MSYPLIVSFHTGQEPYVTKAKRLAESCAKLGLEWSISTLPDLGSWIENVSMKGEFLDRAMRDLNCPLLWVDADGYLMAKPDLLKDCEADFAIHAVDRHKRSWTPIGRTDEQHLPDSWPGTKWFLTGTMFFNNTPLGRLLLGRWASECASRPRAYQQLLIQEAWASMNTPPNTCWLPATYCSIRGRAWPTVVFHDLASTEHKVVRA